MKIKIGIDPGKQGAIAYMSGGKVLKYMSIPLIKTEINVRELAHLLTPDYIMNETLNGTCEISVALEDVHAMFGASAKSTFAFGHICGFLEGLIVANDYSYVKVQPKIWQKKAWTGIPLIKKAGKNSTDTKAMSRLALDRLFPNESKSIPKTKDGIVDAILIAYWLSAGD
jgi:hypothetical protein